MDARDAKRRIAQNQALRRAVCGPGAVFVVPGVGGCYSEHSSDRGSPAVFLGHRGRVTAARRGAKRSTTGRLSHTLLWGDRATCNEPRRWKLGGVGSGKPGPMCPLGYWIIQPGLAEADGELPHHGKSDDHFLD